MIEPSLVATNRLSFTEPMAEVTNCAPSTLIASAFARSRSSAFSSTETWNGSISCGVTQRPSGTRSTGASTRLAWGDAIVRGSDGRRFAARRCHSIPADVSCGRKAPRPSDKRPDTDSVRVALTDVRNLLFSRADRFVPVSGYPNVGVGGTGRCRFIESEEGQLALGGVGRGSATADKRRTRLAAGTSTHD